MISYLILQNFLPEKLLLMIRRYARVQCPVIYSQTRSHKSHQSYNTSRIVQQMMSNLQLLHQVGQWTIIMHILYSSHVCVQLVSGIAFSAMVKRNELESWGVCFHKKISIQQFFIVKRLMQKCQLLMLFKLTVTKLHQTVRQYCRDRPKNDAPP